MDDVDIVRRAHRHTRIRIRLPRRIRVSLQSPSGLITSRHQHALQTQRADAVLLVGQLPRCGQSYPRRGASRQRWRRRSPCSGAESLHTLDEWGWLGTVVSCWGSSGTQCRVACHLLKISTERFVRRKPIQKLGPRTLLFLTRLRHPTVDNTRSTSLCRPKWIPLVQTKNNIRNLNSAAFTCYISDKYAPPVPGPKTTSKPNLLPTTTARNMMCRL